MRVLRILRYFLSEAFVSLGRSWKVSSIAIVTIALSLFIGGLFLLVGDNLARISREWRRQAKVVVYLHSELPEEARSQIRRGLLETVWIDQVVEVSSQEAEQRFRTNFPSMVGLLEGWEEDPLPPSLEVSFEPARVRGETFRIWADALRQVPGVEMVDDDRDWLGRLETLVAVVRGIGVALGSLLLVAAMFTIASVIRLTVLLYRDEIEVMRLVGATELYVRGPFFVEGLVQGIAGGLLATAALTLAHQLVISGGAQSLMGGLLFGDFLLARYLLALVGTGAAAGLIGAVVSLRGETLKS